MKKVILFNMVSLDGFFEGPGRDIDWHTVDGEFNDFAIEQLKSVGGILFGRVTYELMASYWPTPAARATDPEVAELMNDCPKIVFSKTLEQASWNKTRLIKDNFVDEVIALKEQAGKDLIIFGSASLAASFFNYGLIDEIRVILSPLILANGTPLFKGVHDRINLQHLGTRTFQNGNVLLMYQPVEK